MKNRKTVERNRCGRARLEKNEKLFNVLETTEPKTNEFVY